MPEQTDDQNAANDADLPEGHNAELEDWVDSTPELPTPVIDQIQPVVVTGLGSVPDPPPTRSVDPSEDADEQPSPDTQPPTEVSPRASAPEPARYGDGGWTNDELNGWFEREYGGNDNELLEEIDDGYLIHQVVEQLEERQPEHEVIELKDDYERRLSDELVKDEINFSWLSPELKAKVRDRILSQRAWSEQYEADREAAATKPAGWESSDTTHITVTLPDGSQLTETTDLSSDGGTVQRTLTGRDQAAQQLEDIEAEPIGPAPPAVEPMSSAGGGLPRWMLFGGGGILVAALVRRRWWRRCWRGRIRLERADNGGQLRWRVRGGPRAAAHPRSLQQRGGSKRPAVLRDASPR